MLLKKQWLISIVLLGIFQFTNCFTAYSQNINEAGISELFSSANKFLQSGDFRSAIPFLQEAVNRTSTLTDDQGKETCQTCRFELARAQFQDGSISAAMTVLEEYLLSDPRPKESSALNLQASGFFELQEWDKVEISATKLLNLDRLKSEDEFNGNLLLGQSLYRQEKWNDCIPYLEFAAENTNDKRTKRICNVMVVGAMVKSENWTSLFRLIPQLYRTEAKYDITLNLTLMQAGKSRYEDEDFLNALLLYRMVLPRNVLLDYTDKTIEELENRLAADVRIGIPEKEISKRKNQIDELIKSKEPLIELPPYEDEVTFRIGSIYSEKKRFWEGFVLFDKLYQQDRSSDIGEASMWQSVLILYDVGETERAEERIIKYLNENPSGQYARSLLNLMMRDNYVKREFNDVIDMESYLNVITEPITEEDKAQQSDLHYLLAFAYFQNRDYEGSFRQFSNIISLYPNSIHFNDSRYFRGMTSMLQANYNEALTDFITYRDDNESGEHSAASLFRQAVCQFGMENIESSELLFSEFIKLYPEDGLVSEAYSYRADITASKEASAEIPNPLDIAILDYKKGIDKAVTTLQSSYAAFKAAEVYKLEDKWNEIIDLMNYYLDRWEESANVSEATFWIGRSKINLGEVDSAIDSYLDAIIRFGNDINQLGVDKIINELSDSAPKLLDNDNYDLLTSRIRILESEIDSQEQVLKIRMRAVKSLIDNSEVDFAKEILEENINLQLLSPISLSIICDYLPELHPEKISYYSNYFMSNYEDSELLWKAFKAKAHNLQSDGKNNELIFLIDEAQALFGADSYMGWAQLMKANANYELQNYLQADKDYELITGIRDWKGALHAEAWFKRGLCRQKDGELEIAHTFYQRTYLLFRGYSDGLWAAKAYLAAANILQELGKTDEAIETLNQMLNDKYLEASPLINEARRQLEFL